MDLKIPGRLATRFRELHPVEMRDSSALTEEDNNNNHYCLLVRAYYAAHPDHFSRRGFNPAPPVWRAPIASPTELWKNVIWFRNNPLYTREMIDAYLDFHGRNSGNISASEDIQPRSIYLRVHMIEDQMNEHPEPSELQPDWGPHQERPPRPGIYEQLLTAAAPDLPTTGVPIIHPILSGRVQHLGHFVPSRARTAPRATELDSSFCTSFPSWMPLG